jgi:PST family polysaccharide transporter
MSSQQSVDFYGQFMAVTGFVFVFVIISDLGLPMDLARRLSSPDESARPEELVTSYLWIKTLAAMALLLPFVFLFMFTLSDSYKAALVAFILYLSLSFNMVWYFQGRERLRKYAVIFIATRVMQLVFVSLAVIEGLDVYVCLLSVAAPNLLLVLFALIEIFQRSDWRAAKFERKLSLSVLRGSTPFYGARAPLLLYENSSVFFASQLLGQIDVGVYAVALQVYRAFCAIAASISATLLPYLNRTKNLKALYIAAIGVVVFFFLAVFFMRFLGDEALNTILTWIGSPPINLVYVVLVTAMMYALASIFGYPFLVSINKTTIAHVTILVCSLLYYPALWFFDVFVGSSVYTMFFSISFSISLLVFSRLFFFLVYCRASKSA